jgi:hypothetical protein
MTVFGMLDQYCTHMYSLPCPGLAVLTCRLLNAVSDFPVFSTTRMTFKRDIDGHVETLCSPFPCDKHIVKFHERTQRSGSVLGAIDIDSTLVWPIISNDTEVSNSFGHSLDEEVRVLAGSMRVCHQSAMICCVSPRRASQLW